MKQSGTTGFFKAEPLSLQKINPNTYLCHQIVLTPQLTEWPRTNIKITLSTFNLASAKYWRESNFHMFWHKRREKQCFDRSYLLVLPLLYANTSAYCYNK
jgi:hypothetical protein